MPLVRLNAAFVPDVPQLDVGVVRAGRDEVAERVVGKSGGGGEVAVEGAGYFGGG